MSDEWLSYDDCVDPETGKFDAAKWYAVGKCELCEDCGEEAGNHSADCPTWGDPWDDGSTGHD